MVPTAKNDPELGDAVTVPQGPNESAAGKVTIAPGPPWLALVATVLSFGHSSVQAGGVPPAPPIVTLPELAVLSAALSSSVSLETVAMLVTVLPAEPAVKVISNKALARPENWRDCKSGD